MRDGTHGGGVGRGPDFLHEAERREKIFGTRIAMGRQQRLCARPIMQLCERQLELAGCDPHFVGRLAADQ
ncbi:MAG: hypothetical protein IH881_18810 [Myxococcales bacterium]|nr:hypothetical protein [Myxococcales bacterium]